MLTKFQFYWPQVVKISKLCVLGQSVSQKIACFKKLMYLYETTSLCLCDAKASDHRRHSVANASVRFLFPFFNSAVVVISQKCSFCRPVNFFACLIFEEDQAMRKLI